MTDLDVASTSQESPSLMESKKLIITLLSDEWRSSIRDWSTLIRELAIQFAKHPYVDVSVYLPRCSDEDRRDAKSHNVQLIEARELPGYKPIDWLASLPNGHHPHYVVGHGVRLGRLISHIQRQRPHKWIQVVHTPYEEIGMFKSYEQGAISRGEKKQRAEVKLCELADEVVAIGPKLANAYTHHLRLCKKNQPIFNLTPGIFVELCKVEQALEEGKNFCVLLFGCGDHEDFELKGYDIAVKAIAQLKDKSYHLNFAGAPKGKEEEVASKLCQYGIPRSQLTVRCLEDREQLANLLCEADLAIMPSRTEGFGLKGLEALSAGLPVLVSGNSGLGQALEEVPFGSPCVIDSEDPKEWTDAIRVIRQKKRPVRLEEATKLRKEYEKKYSWQRQCGSLLEKMKNPVSVDPVTRQPLEASEENESSTTVVVQHEGRQLPLLRQLIVLRQEHDNRDARVAENSLRKDLFFSVKD